LPVQLQLGASRRTDRGLTGGQRRRHQRRAVQTAEVCLPQLPTGFLIAVCEPTDVVAVRPRGWWQHTDVATGAVQRYQFANEQRQRPAVEQDVVRDDDETPVCCVIFVLASACNLDDHEANRGSAFQIEGSEPFVGVERVHLVGRRGDRAPGHLHPGRHHLNGTAQVTVEEAGPQVRVACQQRCGALAQQFGLEHTHDVGRHRDHIRVLGSSLSTVVPAAQPRQ
jgi:hypothetical protein